MKLNLKKKKQNRFKPIIFGLVVWIKTDLARFFQFGYIFFRFDLVFFGLGSVWFFQFQSYKIKTEPIGFFKFLIGSNIFFMIFFLFFQFNQFFNFFNHLFEHT